MSDIIWTRYFPCGLTFGMLPCNDSRYARYFQKDRQKQTEPIEIEKNRFFATNPK